MPCKLCQSENEQLFPAEVAVHAPLQIDSRNLSQSLIFPQVLVCLECGFAEFSIPEQMLHELSGLQRAG
jgi:hypothetical protein